MSDKGETWLNLPTFSDQQPSYKNESATQHTSISSKATTERNRRARSRLTETHTVGPKRFTQICNKMVKERTAVDGQEKPLVDGQEPPLVLSDDAIFIRMRKRNLNREYKLPVQVLKRNYKLFH